MNNKFNLVNVVIYDGNRKVNWDFRNTKSMKEALEKFGFKWEPNTIRVNGHLTLESHLHYMLGSFVEASKRCGDDTNRLFVTMMRPQKKEDA